MKNRFGIFVTLFILLILSAPAFSQAWKGKGRLTGKVVDAASGTPMEGVVVKLRNNQIDSELELKTDKEGKFVVNGIKGGSWEIDFKKEGYKTELINYQIMALSYNKPIDMKMQKLGAGVKAAEGAKEIPGMNLVAEAKNLAAAKDIAGAVAKYEAAFAANPTLYWVYGEIGALYEREGQMDNAVAYYQKFLQHEPANAMAKISIANIWFDQKKNDEAKKILTDINLAEVTNANLLYNLGVRFYNANDIQEAIKYFKKSVEVDPKMSDAYLNLGFALASPAVNDIPGAKQAFQKVIEIDPASENAKAAKEFLDTIQ